YQLVAGVAPTIGGQEADTRRVAERAVGHSLTDAQVSDYFFDQAWQWIRHDPAHASWLFVKKIGYAFHAQHVPLPHSYPFYVATAAPALRFAPIGPWLLTPLGLVGLVAAAPRERRLAYVIWASFVPLYVAAVAVFFVADRYRLPLLPALCAGAGGGVAAAWRAIRARDAHFAPAGVAALILAVLANVPIAASDGRWVEGLRLAQRFAMQGRF